MSSSASTIRTSSGRLSSAQATSPAQSVGSDQPLSQGVALRVVHPDDARSPSLRGAGKAPAREMKFLLDEATAREIEQRLRPVLLADPHSQPLGADGAGYHITTLYCDTPDLRVFHRVGRHRYCKFRLRRYDDSPELYLERKAKRRWTVRKRRSTIPVDELAQFGESDPGREWPGAAYHRQLQRNALQPVCLIEYDRVAWFGHCSEGPLRLTFDRRIVGGPTGDWSLARGAVSYSLLADQVVCEFKFRGAMPAPFKEVVQALQLVPRGISKFRQCLTAAGVGLTTGGVSLTNAGVGLMPAEVDAAAIGGGQERSAVRDESADA